MEEEDKVTPEIKLLRAKVRPIITKVLTGVWSGITAFIIVYSLMQGIDPLTSLGIDKYYQGITGITIGTIVWYFGDRTYFKRKNGD